MRMLFCRTMLRIFALMACGTVLAAEKTSSPDFLLTSNGMAKSIIVTPDVPTQAEMLAADRLQHYIEAISGARLPIVKESAEHQGSYLFIGKTNASSALRQKLVAMKPPAEASLTCVKHDRAYIVGIDDAGVVHATYFLLEGLGCRWYFPADWGTIIPKREELSLPQGETYHAPDFAIRAGLPGFSLNNDNDHSWMLNEWGRANHLGGWKWWGSGHSYQYLVDFKQFKAHPEWFAYYDGARHPHQLCTTNPEVRQQALQKVLRVLSAPDAPRLICISPCDGSGFCECDNCRKLIPTKPDGTKDVGNSIDRIVEFANFIADNIRDKYPDHYVTYFCDYHSVGIPTLVTPSKNTVFWIVQWSQDHFHGVSPATKMGQSLERWSKFGNPMFVYTYYGSYGSFTFWPQVHAIRDDIPYYRKKGVIGLYSETHAHWGTQHLNFLVFPRLLWDADTNVDSMIDDFCDKFFGPAAAPMRKYYNLLEQTAENGPAQYHYHSGIVAIFQPEKLEQLRKLIGQALESLKDADPVYRQRMQFVADGFHFADLYISANHLKRVYGRSKDPALRAKMIQMYKEALSLATASHYANRLIDDSIAIKPMKTDLVALEKGTRFGVGKFSYSDCYIHGGNTPLDAIRRIGFLDGTWGLNLKATSQGELLYHFQAEGGVFSNARITDLVFGSNLMGFRVEAGPNADGPWQVVTAQEKPTPDKPAGSSMPVDFSTLIRGKTEFYLRLTATSDKEYTCALCRLGIEGEVTPRANR